VQDICKRVDLSSLHAGDEDHQPNVGGQALPDLNAPPADDDCQADGEVTFVVPMLFFYAFHNYVQEF